MSKLAFLRSSAAGFARTDVRVPMALGVFARAPMTPGARDLSRRTVRLPRACPELVEGAWLKMPRFHGCRLALRTEVRVPIALGVCSGFSHSSRLPADAIESLNMLDQQAALWVTGWVTTRTE